MSSEVVLDVAPAPAREETDSSAIIVHSEAPASGGANGPLVSPGAAQLPPQCGHNHGPHGRCGRQGPPPAAPAAPLTPTQELFACAKRNDLPRFVQLVAEYGDELVRANDGRDPQGHTLAHWAAQNASGEFLSYLQSLGAPLDLPSTDGKAQLHPIHWACAAGNLRALRALVLKLQVDVNTCDAAKGRSPLLMAAQHGHPLIVLFCVRHGADVTLRDADGDTAVHWAAYKGATEIVAVFQYLGLSSDAPDRFGQTPLHLAAMRGELSTVQFLVEELDANVKALDDQQRSPRELARLKGFRHVEQYLHHRELREAAWHVAAFTWWCDSGSRAPYYFTLLNAVCALLFYFLVLFPALPERKNVFVPHMAWNAVTWLFFYLTVTTRPGSVPQDGETYTLAYTRVTDALVTGDPEEGDEPQEGEESASARAQRQCLERPLCHTCHVQRPPRAKHCRVCKTCVPVFDHHCPFVDNCVGRDNYAVFLLFVCFLTVDLAVLEYALWLLWRWRPQQRLLAGIGMLYALVLLLPVAQLAGFHLYLLARNRTTNEVLNAQRYRSQPGRMRSYDRGVLRNVTDRCCFPHQLDQELDERQSNEEDEVDTRLLDQKLRALPA